MIPVSNLLDPPLFRIFSGDHPPVGISRKREDECVYCARIGTSGSLHRDRAGPSAKVTTWGSGYVLTAPLSRWSGVFTDDLVLLECWDHTADCCHGEPAHTAPGVDSVTRVVIGGRRQG